MPSVKGSQEDVNRKSPLVLGGIWPKEMIVQGSQRRRNRADREEPARWLVSRRIAVSERALIVIIELWGARKKVMGWVSFFYSRRERT